MTTVTIEGIPAEFPLGKEPERVASRGLGAWSTGWIFLILPAHLHIEQLDFPMEMTPFDFQLFSRTRNVPMMLAQLSRDIILFKCIAGVPERVIRLHEERIDRGSCRLGRRPNRTRLQRESPLALDR